MDDSDFWRDLAERFRAVDPYPILRADWQYTVMAGAEPPPLATWRLAGADRNTRSIQLEFESLARRGGPKVYPNMDSLMGWLEALRGHRLNVESEGMGLESGPDGSTVGHHYFGSIVRVCQASADLCKILESLALETERLARLREEVQAKAEQQQPYRAALDANESVTEPLRSETVSSQLNRLREECRFTVEALAEAIGVDPTTVSRHLSGAATPQLRTLGAYDRTFSNKLGRKMVIEKTPGKRQ